MNRLLSICFALSVIFSLAPSPVQAQESVLDGWFQCFTHYESGIELSEPDVIYYPSIFSPGGSYAVPYANMTYGVYANWVCTPFVDGVITLGVDLPNAVGTLKTSKSLMTLVVPPGVVGWTLDCAWQYEKSSGASQQLKNNGGPYVDVSPSLSTASASGSGAATVYVTAAGLTGPNRTNWDAAVTEFPDLPSPSANSVSGWYLYSFANTGHGETIFSTNEIACSVQQVLEYDEPTETVITYERPELGWDYTPPTPTPIGGATPLTATSWVASPSTTAEIGITSGSRFCYTIIPDFSWGPYSVFGYTLGWDFTFVDLCTTPKTLSLEFLGINFAAWITAIVAIGGVGLLYSRLR